VPAFPFDPVQRSRKVERLVMSGRKRRYYKFRAAPYYGRIATADAIGCSFLCAYCRNYSRNENPSSCGRLYSPEEVARNLIGPAPGTPSRSARVKNHKNYHNRQISIIYKIHNFINQCVSVESISRPASQEAFSQVRFPAIF